MKRSLVLLCSFLAAAPVHARDAMVPADPSADGLQTIVDAACFSDRPVMGFDPAAATKKAAHDRSKPIVQRSGPNTMRFVPKVDGTVFVDSVSIRTITNFKEVDQLLGLSNADVAKKFGAPSRMAGGVYTYDVGDSEEIAFVFTAGKIAEINIKCGIGTD